MFILEVSPDGAVGKDGRLQAGDQILYVCNENFKEIEHEKAHVALLKASLSGTVRSISLSSFFHIISHSLVATLYLSLDAL